jgi:hypothetical protein
MANIWDYDEKELKKTKSGKLLILERQINYGFARGDKEKIDLNEVKKNWDKLNLFPPQRRLMELLIWGHYRSSPKNKKSFWMR